MDQEQAWIDLARRGDQRAFGQLVRAYERPVYNLAYRMLGDTAEAEDAAQEAFVRAYTRLSTYQPDRKFANWLLSITSHHCIDRLRRRSRLRQTSLEEMLPSLDLVSDDPQPDQVVSRKQERDRVWQVLRALPPDYRAAIVLRYWHDLSYEEIAAATGDTESAIKSRLHRARQMMAERMGRLEG